MESRKLTFAAALTPQGWLENVTVMVGAAGLISSVTPNTTISGGGIAVPAMPNVHSHAHQRLMQGLAERSGPGADSFWTWRETMYGFASKLSPDDLEAVAAQAYLEMLKSGFGVVGEFQYLHHQPDGSPYHEVAEMSLRCVRAAEQAGIAITILPTLYRYGGFGAAEAGAGQRRFLNGADRFLRIYNALCDVAEQRHTLRVGISPHSFRAVDEALLRDVLNGIDSRSPVHVHVAEQLKEVDDCIAWCGKRPIEYLLDTFNPDSRWTAIHATHMTDEETTRLAASGVIAGLCPTTEANLGDGIFPATSYLGAGGAMAIGSDSHITISPAEDLRMLDYSQRLRDRSRTALAGGPRRSTGRSLYEAALAGGATSMAQPVGAIAPGYRADIAVLDPDHPSLYGRRGDDALDSWIFSAGNAAVRDVYVAGLPVITDRHHPQEERIAARFRHTVERLMS